MKTSKNYFAHVQEKLFLCVLLASLPVLAITRVWNGGGTDSLFQTSSNWVGGSSPSSGDSAIFNSTSQKRCIINSNISLMALIIDAGFNDTVFLNSSYIVSINQDLSIASGTFVATDGSLDVNGDVNITGGTFDRPVNGSFYVFGSWNKTGGSLTWSSQGFVSFDGSATGKTINVGGTGTGYNIPRIVISGAGGAWTITGNDVTCDTLVMNNGLLNFGAGRTVTTTGMQINGGTLEFGSSKLKINGDASFNNIIAINPGTGSLEFSGPGNQNFTPRTNTPFPSIKKSNTDTLFVNTNALKCDSMFITGGTTISLNNSYDTISTIGGSGTLVMNGAWVAFSGGNINFSTLADVKANGFARITFVGFVPLRTLTPKASLLMPRIDFGGWDTLVVNSNGLKTKYLNITGIGEWRWGSGLTHEIDTLAMSNGRMNFGSSTVKIPTGNADFSTATAIIPSTGTLEFSSVTAQHQQYLFIPTPQDTFPNIIHSGTDTLMLNGGSNTLYCNQFSQTAGSLYLSGKNIVSLGDFSITSGTSSSFAQNDVITHSLDNRKITVMGNAVFNGQSGSRINLNSWSGPCTLDVGGTLTANYDSIVNCRVIGNPGIAINSRRGAGTGNDSNWVFVRTWTGSSSWDTPSNWAENEIPITVLDSVVFLSGGNCQLSTGPYPLRSIVFANTYTGNFNLSGQYLSIQKTGDFRTGGSFTSNNGTINFSGTGPMKLIPAPLTTLPQIYIGNGTTNIITNRLKADSITFYMGTLMLGTGFKDTVLSIGYQGGGGSKFLDFETSELVVTGAKADFSQLQLVNQATGKIRMERVTSNSINYLYPSQTGYPLPDITIYDCATCTTMVMGSNLNCDTLTIASGVFNLGSYQDTVRSIMGSGILHFGTSSLTITGNMADFSSLQDIIVTGNFNQLTFYNTTSKYTTLKPKPGFLFPYIQNMYADTVQIAGAGLHAKKFFQGAAGDWRWGVGLADTVDTMVMAPSGATNFQSATVVFKNDVDMRWSKVIRGTGTIMLSDNVGHTQNLYCNAVDTLPDIVHNGTDTLKLDYNHLRCASFSQTAGQLAVNGFNIYSAGNFSITNGTSTTIVPANGTALDGRTIMVGGNATLVGQPGNLLNLQAGATQWTLNVAGTVTAENDSIKMCQVTSAPATAINSGDGGGNTNWIFSSVRRWTGTGNWSNPTNWDPNGLPGVSDSIAFVSGSGNCVLDIPDTVTVITFTSGYTGTFSFGTNMLSVWGNADFRSGGTITPTGGTLRMGYNGGGYQHTFIPKSGATMPRVVMDGNDLKISTNDLNAQGFLKTTNGGRLDMNGFNITVLDTFTYYGNNSSDSIGNLAGRTITAPVAKFVGWSQSSPLGLKAPSSWILAVSGKLTAGYVTLKNSQATGVMGYAAVSNDSLGNTNWGIIGSSMWDGEGSTNNWSEKLNWLPDTLPQSVIFTNFSTKNCMLDTSVTVQSFQLTTGYTGTFNFSSKTLTLNSNNTSSASTEDFRSGGDIIPGTGALVLNASTSPVRIDFFPRSNDTLPPITLKGMGSVTVKSTGLWTSKIIDSLSGGGDSLVLANGTISNIIDSLRITNGKLVFGSSTVRMTGSGMLDLSGCTGLTPGAGTLEFAASSGTQVLKAPGGMVLPSINHSGSGPSILQISPNNIRIAGSFAQNTGWLDLSAANIDSISGNMNIYAGTYLTGLSGRKIWIGGNAVFNGQSGSLLDMRVTPLPCTLSVQGTLNANYATLKNVHAVGGNAGTADVYSADSGGNINWTFVDVTPPTVTSATLTSPNGGEVLKSGMSFAITWNNAGITDAQLKAYPIKLQYLDTTSIFTIADPLQNTGTYTWTVPSTSSSQIRVCIAATDSAGNIAYDTSNGVFTIDNKAPVVSTITLTSLNGGQVLLAGSTVAIGWNTNNIVDIRLKFNPIALRYSTDGGSTFPYLMDTLQSFPGPYNWTVPSINSSSVRIRLTVTDSVGFVGYDTSNANVTIDNLAPAVSNAALTSPNGGEVLKGGASKTISWNSGLISDLQLRQNPISLAYSIDGGSSFANAIASNIINNGTYTWTLPSITSSTVRVRISATDSVGQVSFDTSNANFSIDITPPTVTNATIISPNGGEVWQTNTGNPITWNNSGITDAMLKNNPVTLEYSVDSSSWNIIASNELNDGSFTWTPTLNHPAVRVRIGVSDSAGNVAYDTCNTTFMIDNAAPAVSNATLSAPNGGEVLRGGTSMTVLWSAVSISDIKLKNNPVTLQYSTDGGANFLYTIATGIGNTGSYTWTLPTIDNATVRVRIMVTDSIGLVAYDTSNGNFTIDNTPPTVLSNFIMSPNGGEVWAGGSAHTIKWFTAGGMSDMMMKQNPFTLSYSTDGGSSFAQGIASTLSKNDSTYLWTLPSINSSTVRIRIAVADSVGFVSYDTSNANFVIDNTLPTVSSATLTSPNGGEVLKNGTSFPITWNTSSITDAQLKANPITLQYLDTASTVTIAANLSNSGTYNWTVPSISASQIKVRIMATDSVGNVAYDTSNGVFIIDNAAPVVSATMLTSLNGGQVLLPGSVVSIGWNTNNAVDLRFKFNPITLRYSTDGGATFPYFIDTLITFAGPYNWTVPSINSSSVRIRLTVTDSVGFVGYDTSNANFTIDNMLPTSTITSPVNKSTFTVFPMVNGTASDSGSGVSQVQVALFDTLNHTWWSGSSWGTQQWLAATGTTSWYFTASGDSLLVNHVFVIMSRAIDAAGNIQTIPATDTIMFDNTPLMVTINQGPGQSDPSATMPIMFRAVFSKPVTNFTNGKVALSGTANPTTQAITEVAPFNRTAFDVAVGGMDRTGDVVVTVMAGAVTDYAGNSNQASSITDNSVIYTGNIPIVQCVNSTMGISEGGGTIYVYVNLSTPSGLAISVPFTLSGTAQQGVDYSLTGVFTFAPGDTNVRLPITVVNDTVFKGNRTVIMTLGTPTNAALGARIVDSMVIIEDDPMPSVSFFESHGTTGESGPMRNIVATLSKPSGIETRLPVHIVGGTAALSVDYTLPQDTIVFFPGATAGSISIFLIDDQINEPDETIFLAMGTPHGATAAAPMLDTITILDNDPQPSVSFEYSHETQTPINDTISFTVGASLSGLSTLNVTVPLAFFGTALRGRQYQVSDSAIVIPAGSLHGTIAISVRKDSVPVAGRTIIVAMLPPFNAQKGAIQQDSISLGNAAPWPIVSFANSFSRYNANVGRIIIPVCLSAPSAMDVNVPFSFSGNALSAIDYTPDSMHIIIQSGKMCGQLSMSVRNDSLRGPDKSIIVRMDSPTYATTAGGISLDTIIITYTDSTPGVTPTIFQQPLSRTVKAGDSLMLSCAASGQGPMIYAWFKVGRTDTLVYGTHLYFAAVTPADSGMYFCAVRNAFGEARSTIVRVSISGTTLVPPSAAFSALQRTGNDSLMVQFIDSSKGVISLWKWSWGDGSIDSFTVKPVAGIFHRYARHGMFTVSLTVSNAAGANTNTKPGYIVLVDRTPPPLALTVQFSRPNDSTLAVSIQKTATTLTDIKSVLFTMLFRQKPLVFGPKDTLPYSNTTFTTFANKAGNWYAMYALLDSSGNRSTVRIDSFMVPNNPPVMAPLADIVLREDSVWAVSARASDKNNDSLTFLLIKAPTGMIINPVNGGISWTPRKINTGISTIVVGCKDPFNGLGLDTFSITVTSINHPPVTTLIKRLHLTTVGAAQFNATATDLENNWNHAYRVTLRYALNATDLHTVIVDSLLRGIDSIQFSPLIDGHYIVRIAAQDSTGAVDPNAPEVAFAIAGASSYSLSDTTGTWRCMSVPAVTYNATTIKASGAVSFWDESRPARNIYSYYTPSSEIADIKAGKSYWIKTVKPVAIALAATDILRKPVTIRLDSADQGQGWNQIASPYPYPVKWTYNTNSLWEYNPDIGSFQKADSVLFPWKGYWVQSRTDSINIDPVPVFRSASLAKRAMVQFADKYEWQAQIVLQCNNHIDADNRIGFLQKASNGYDQNDWPKPPAFTGNRTLFMYHPEWNRSTKEYASDIRKNMGPLAIFPIAITPGSSQATITIDAPDQIRSTFFFFMASKDTIHRLENGQSIVIDPSDSMTYRALFVSTSPTLSYVRELLLFNPYPNPCRPVVTINYAVPFVWNAQGISTNTQNVKIQIFDGTGRLIRTLVDRPSGPGMYKTLWDGKTSSGRRSASGNYFIRLHTGSKSLVKQVVMMK